MAVRAIRGATTTLNNDSAEIIAETEVLLHEIIKRNDLDTDDIISALFTVTKDLDAAFPAAAARKIGWTGIALLCTNEIDVPGSLGKCIRVMVYFNTDKTNNQIKHVYLNEAKILRPDLGEDSGGVKKISIAIDGPAGSGKSTIAKNLSKILGIVYLDTGAMYRTVALKAIREGIDTLDREAVKMLVPDIDIQIKYMGNEQRIFLDDEDVSDKIRTRDISLGASNVAVVPEVRVKMVQLQREIAEKFSVVMDGRDIGTYVLPNANLKIYLTASESERAKRRYLEELAKGTQNLTLEDIVIDLQYRDKNDSSRDFAPLRKAQDAVELDTTGMSADEVTNYIIGLVKEISKDK